MADVLLPHDRSSGPRVTGVGSLPYTDPTDAIAFVARHAPHAPFWPQLSRRSPKEGMVAQVLGEAPIGSAWVDGRLCARPLPGELQTIIHWLETEEAVLRRDRAAGFFALLDALDSGWFKDAPLVKAQLAGPWTIAGTLANDLPQEEMIALRDACAEYVGRLARWIAATLGDVLSPGLGRLITIDEPLLPGLSDLPDLPDPADLADRRTGCDYLRPVYAAIRGEGAAAGVHCCGAPPFDALAASNPDVISFDAIQYGARFFESADAMQWMAQGGHVAAGLAPTDRGLDAREAAAAARTWGKSADQAGVDPVPWAVTATCGLGLRAPELATAVFESTWRIAAAF